MTHSLSFLFTYHHHAFCLPTTIMLSVAGVQRAGHTLHSSKFFDTVKFLPKMGQQHIRDKAIAHKINLRYFQDGCVSGCHGTVCCAFCLTSAALKFCDIL